jgi:polar amino acid transport system substrate-binding protein
MSETGDAVRKRLEKEEAMGLDDLTQLEALGFKELSRRRFLRGVGTLSAAGLALPAIGLIEACGGSSPSSSTTGNDLLSKVRKAGVINIGLANDPPASIINPDGSVSGQGPATVEKIMQKLGVPKVNGIVATFGELVPGLQAGRWDMIGGVISVTKARCAIVQYTDPFEFNGMEIAWFPDAVPQAPTSIADVGKRGLITGFNSGSAYIAVAKNLGVQDSQIQQFQDTAALLEALRTKRIQVIISDTGSLTLTPAQVAKYPFQHLDYPPDGPFIAGALAFRKSDKTMFDAFQKEFKKMKDSGEFDKISQQFQFPPLPADKKNLGPDQVCAKVV